MLVFPSCPCLNISIFPFLHILPLFVHAFTPVLWMFKADFPFMGHPPPPLPGLFLPFCLQAEAVVLIQNLSDGANSYPSVQNKDQDLKRTNIKLTKVNKYTTKKRKTKKKEEEKHEVRLCKPIPLSLLLNLDWKHFSSADSPLINIICFFASFCTFGVFCFACFLS